MEAIKEAARLGGADEFIEKQQGGYGAKYSDGNDTLMFGDVPKGSALDTMIKDRKDPVPEFSGGQVQRLAL